jgi:hypothetical protein
MFLSALPVLIGAAVLGGTGVVVYLTWYFSAYQSNLRAIRGASRVSVAGANAGEIVRVIGKLRSIGEPLSAPLTGRACSHFDLQVDVLVSTGKSSSWRSLFREVGSKSFAIEDSSGQAIVDTSSFAAAVVLDQHASSGTFNDATPELEALLARHGEKSTDFLGMNKGLRYREGVLEPGEAVAVVGRARWEDDPDVGGAVPSGREGYRGSARTQRLVLEAHSHPVRASDDPAAFD